MNERFPKINGLYAAPSLNEGELSHLRSYLGSKLVNLGNYQRTEISLLGKDVKILLQNDYQHGKLTPELMKLFNDGLCEAIGDYQLGNCLMVQ